MITGLHHTGLVVRDLEAALAFYSQERAFRLVHRFEVADTATNRALLQIEDASAQAAFLQGSLGGLELFEFRADRPAIRAGRDVFSAGIRHICLQTAISDRLFDALTAAGARSHARPAGLGTGNSYVYLRDPEDNLLELEGTPWAPAGATRPWFAHTAIVTHDIARLTRFYAMLTGIEVHRQGDFGPAAKFDVVAGIPEVRFKGAWLRLANAELEFWQYLHPATTATAPRDAAAPGWNHLCLESDDIEADFARLVAQGVETHGPPQDFGLARLFFCRDPDGNLVEILQPPPASATCVRMMLEDVEGRLVDAARTTYRQGAASPPPPAPPATRTWAVNGIELHGLEQGAGPPLLLLHGFPDHAAAWRPLMTRLQGSLRVVAPDQRGYGDSSRPAAVEDYRIDLLVADLIALLDALGLPEVHLCGHDWGGVLAFELAARCPGRVASLVALNAPPREVLQHMIWHDPAQRAASQYISLLRSPGADAIFHESAAEGLVERFLGDPRRRGRLTDEEVAAYRAAWSRPDAWRPMLAWYRAAPFDVPTIGAPPPGSTTGASSPLIDCPVLLIWGERDAVFVPAMAEAIAAACKDCRVERLTEAGHVPHRDEPDRCAALIRDFIAHHPIDTAKGSTKT